MATGMQVAEVLIECAKMATGTGFTAHLDLDHSPHIVNTAKPDVLARQLAGEVIQQRMSAAKTLTEKLVSLCYESGVIWVHPERGKAIQTNQELTPDEEKALQDLQSELVRIDTFIRL